MNKILVLILMLSNLVLAQCAKSKYEFTDNTTAKIEIPETKKFVLGKWKLTDSRKNYYLIFEENNTVIQELYDKQYNGEINRYEYKINENNEVEIRQNYSTNLIVKRINENKIRLKAKAKEGETFLSPPILFMLNEYDRVFQ